MEQLQLKKNKKENDDYEQYARCKAWYLRCKP